MVNGTSPPQHQQSCHASGGLATRRPPVPHRALRRASEAEIESAAGRSGGPVGWYAVVGWAPADFDCPLFRFATTAEVEAMQRWIAESGVHKRPPPGPYRSPMLGVAVAQRSRPSSLTATARRVEGAADYLEREATVLVSLRQFFARSVGIGLHLKARRRRLPTKKGAGCPAPFSDRLRAVLTSCPDRSR